MEKDLTEKQKRFAHEYIGCYNAAEAARRAGYAKPTARAKGYQLLERPGVKQLIAELEEQKLRALEGVHLERIATLEEILEYLTSIMRDPKQRASERTKAADLLGRRYAAWESTAEKQAAGVNLTVQIMDCENPGGEDV